MPASRFAARPRMWVGLFVMMFGLLLPSAASAATTGTFSCRASAARIALAGGLPVIEPFVANKADNPCLTDSQNVLTPTTVGPLTVNAVNVATTITPQTDAGASSTVTNPTVNLGSGALVVHADVVSAAAGYRCVNGTPQPFTSGQVVALTINGNAITIPPGTNVTIPLGPLGTLVLNQVLTNSTTVVRRAIALMSPLGAVVLSEAMADLSGAPCAVPTPAGTAKIVVSPAGAARLIAEHRCVSNRFNAAVLGTEISDVVFSVDGRQVARRTSSPYLISIDPTPGHHVLSAQVTFVPASNTAARTLSLPYTGCAARQAGGHARLEIAPRAAARLIAAHRCVRDTFYATVVGTQIQSVVFSLDGSDIATRTHNPFRTAVHPTPGHHTLLARVTFRRSSHTRARVLRAAYTGCPGPRFTG